MAQRKRTAARKPRNRSAQDVTLINLRALKGRVATLERVLNVNIESLRGRVAALEDRVSRLTGDTVELNANLLRRVRTLEAGKVPG